MQVDWRIGAFMIAAVLVILLVAALAGPGAGVGDNRSLDSGGPPACPPGHVTSQGCSKP
jgi:hypothetical protein